MEDAEIELFGPPVADGFRLGCRLHRDADDEQQSSLRCGGAQRAVVGHVSSRKTSVCDKALGLVAHTCRSTVYGRISRFSRYS
eukprot:scaffold16384_cov103-Skeletonema_menzelii.AAC.2